MSREYTFEKIDLDKLVLDECNPRLPRSFHNKSEQEIINYLLLNTSLVELMQAIGENDFFPGEQLLVVKKEEDEEMIVVEGNRRLTALRLLSNPTLAEVQTNKVNRVVEAARYKPSEIPCLVFEDRNEIIRYLGYRHITGIQSWKSLEKARYLFGLYEDSYNNLPFNQACKEIAKIIGSRMDYVRRILTGFRIYKYIEDHGFFSIRDLDDTTFYFNYIADSLNHTQITKFFGVDFSLEDPLVNKKNNSIKEWTEWLFMKNDQNKTRLKGKSDDLNKLNKILSKDDSLKAFREGLPLNKAFELTEEIDDLFMSSIKKSLDYLIEADGLSFKVIKFYNDLDEDLKSILRVSRKIKNSKDDREYETE